MVAERALPEKKLPLPPGTPMSLLQAVF